MGKLQPLCALLLTSPFALVEAQSSALAGVASTSAISKDPEACVVMGQGGLIHWQRCTGLQEDKHASGIHIPIDGKLTWACVVPDFGLAVCDEGKSVLRLWEENSSTFVDVDLGPLTAPVGAVHLNGKIYIACFGSWPSPVGDSGLAVVDVASSTLEAIYPYTGNSASHLHNVYVFDWLGSQEIFVAVLGNPWTSDPLPGDGLVRFDRSDGSFLKLTTVRGSKQAALNARSAVQQPDGVIYVLTQEPAGEQTRLARLEAQGGVLTISAETLLPPRDGGDGGADVFLGKDLDTVFCTDRTLRGGKLYYYTYAASAGMLRGSGHQAQMSSGSFAQLAARNTGANPRHAAHLPSSGDVVVCNQDEATLTVFVGLAGDPTSKSVEVTLPTNPVTQSSFFIKF